MSRLLPLIAIVLLGLTAAVWRTWLQKRRHGTTGLMILRSGRFTDRARDAGALLLFLAMFVQAAIAAWQDEPLAFVTEADLTPPGATLMLVGLVLLVAAQLDLGASWRIGIEEEARPGLVTTGLYRFCRNPIFLGLLTFIVGYAAVLPTRLSLFFVVAFYVGVRLQIAAEEAWLTRAYGDAFSEYARRVGRFVPWIGRKP